MSIGSTGGDDVRHSSVMLGLGKHMKITMAVKMELSVKWHILGKRGNREEREGEGGKGKKERGGERGGPRPERTWEVDSLPGFWRTGERTRRREKMHQGEERVFGVSMRNG